VVLVLDQEAAPVVVRDPDQVAAQEVVLKVHVLYCLVRVHEMILKVCDLFCPVKGRKKILKV
jgi:hypothetical protein